MNNKKVDRIFDVCSILVILTLALFLIWMAYINEPLAKGEADDYALATVAIQKTGNLVITRGIIDQAKLDFPNFADRLEDSWNNANAGGTELYQAYNGKLYPWYGGGYSALCIFAKIFLQIMNLNQSYAFQITNICLYIMALTYVFVRLKESRKNVFLLILLLACSPTVVYCSWPSAEVFIFSFIVLSLTNYVNQNYKRAAIYISFAGMMNTTAMIWGVLLIIDYFFEMLRGVKNVKEVAIVLTRNWKKIFTFGICFLPSLTTYAYNILFLHTLELQTNLGLASFTYWFGRIKAYLFDLSMGYIAYYTIIFTVWIFMFICSLLKRKRKMLVLSTGFLGVVMAYSVTLHINCGMEGIARYSAWASPIFLFGVVTQYEKVFLSVFRKIVTILIPVSACCTVLILGWFYNDNAFACFDYSPLAKVVLNNYPQLYNPYPYTFVSRTNHVDGGYWGDQSKELTIYTDDDGYIRKILLVDETKQYILNHLAGDMDAVSFVIEKINNADKLKRFQYINIPSDLKVFIDPGYPACFYPAEDDTLYLKNQGIYSKEGDCHWFTNNALITLKNEEIEKSGLEIDFYVLKELVQKYENKEMIMKVYCNSEYIGEISLAQEGWNKATFSAENIPQSLSGYYRIALKSECYLQPIKDVAGSKDNRFLCILVPYIGTPK